jgi:UDP-GlcNAc:undecaprenyl-phosphate GlcNAc-1-phosphate transferase
MYRASWKLAGIDAFRRLGLAVICGSIAGLAVLELIRPRDVSFSVFGIYTFVALVLATGTRVSYRLADQVRMQTANGGERTLIYGAGTGGSSAVREMLSNPAVGLTPVGFIDDNPHRVGKTVNGYPILGNVDQTDAALTQSGAKVVVVSSQKIPEQKVAQAQRVCRARGARLVRMHIDFDEVSNLEAGIVRPDAVVAEGLQPFGQTPADRQ